MCPPQHDPHRLHHTPARISMVAAAVFIDTTALSDSYHLRFSHHRQPPPPPPTTTTTSAAAAAAICSAVCVCVHTCVYVRTLVRHTPTHSLACAHSPPGTCVNVRTHASLCLLSRKEKSHVCLGLTLRAARSGSHISSPTRRLVLLMTRVA
jgi:hypothetical protein